MLTTTSLLLCSLAWTLCDCPPGRCVCAPVGHHAHRRVVAADSVLLPAEPTADAAGIVGGTDRPRLRHLPAPVVRLRLADPPAAMELSSEDAPQIWAAIPMDSYAVIVEIPATDDETQAVKHVQLLLDGQLQTGGSKQNPRSYKYSLPCPAPGKHLVQARYLYDGHWSPLSLALRFDARVPMAPRIVGAGIDGYPPAALMAGRVFQATSDKITLRLANVQAGDRLVAYIDGRPVQCASDAVASDCCFTINLEGHVEPGIHHLAVQTASRDNCRVASEPSPELLFRYQVEGHYTIGFPRGRCSETAAPGPCSQGKGSTTTDPAPQYPGKKPPLSPQAGQNSETNWLNPSQLPDRNVRRPAIRFASFIMDDPLPGTGEMPKPVPTAKPAMEPRGANRIETKLESRVAAKVESRVESTAGSRIETRVESRIEDRRESKIEDAATHQSETKKEAPKPEAKKEEPKSETKKEESKPETQKEAPKSETKKEEPKPEVKKEDSKTISFLASAHFPLREFGPNGETLDREGVVIYEDMQFSYWNNGDFSVHFTASLPPVPTTLRLRFLLQKKNGGPWYTVTLEPETFQPLKDGSGKPQRGTVERRISGHSEAITTSLSGDICNLRREGTARFGSGLAGLGQNTR